MRVVCTERKGLPFSLDEAADGAMVVGVSERARSGRAWGAGALHGGTDRLCRGASPLAVDEPVEGDAEDVCDRDQGGDAGGGDRSALDRRDMPLAWQARQPA